MDELHRRYAHIGSTRLAKLAAEVYWWPGLTKDATEFVAHCLPCQLTKAVFHRSERIFTHLQVPAAPRLGWSIDMGPRLRVSAG